MGPNVCIYVSVVNQLKDNIIMEEIIKISERLASLAEESKKQCEKIIAEIERQEKMIKYIEKELEA